MAPERPNLFGDDGLAEQSKKKYLGKYSEKLEKKIKEEKVSSFEELKKKVIESKEKEKESTKDAKPVVTPLQKQLPNGHVQKPAVAKKKNTLDEILKLEEIESVPADLIGKLWAEHHSQKELYVSGTLTNHAFRKFKQRTILFNRFVFPVPRQDGLETFFVETSLNSQTAFVSLLEYKLHKENAQPCLVLDFYPELADQKDLVLFRGLVESKKLGREEGKYLSNLLFSFYLDSEPGFELIKLFNQNPKDFIIQDVINLIQNRTL
jgi:ATP synthase F1 complex assembly factor 1